MKHVSVTALLFFLLMLMSCNGNMLNDAESIKDSENSGARGANNERTVTFNCQNADGDAGDTLFTRTIAGSETTLGLLPADPVKTGYGFAGWWTASNGGGSSFHADTVVSADITVYAKWSTMPVYHVSFDTAGGSPVSSRKVIENSTLKSPGNPDKTGYLFGGWFCERSCSTPWNFDTNTVTRDTVLYAKWDSYTWKVTFTDTAEHISDTVVEVSSPETFTGTLPEDTVKNGTYFAGWWTGENGTGTQFTSSTPVTADITVYAAWSESPVYVVSFDSLGGTPVGSQNIGYGKQASEPDVTTRAGYSFAGWYAEPDGKGKAFSTSLAVASTKTWYACWKNYSYTVTFNSEGASTPASPESMTIESPQTCAERLPAQPPVKTGYLFAGWYTGRNGEGYEFTANTPVTQDMTVFAAWESYEYTVTFDMLTVPGPSTPVTMTVSSPAVTLGNLPDKLSRDGYIFDGWYTEPEGKGIKADENTAIQSDITLYAAWEETCTIAFAANGGTGTMERQVIELGETAPLAHNAYTRPGFTFTGWALSSYGTDAFGDAANFAAETSNVTLYATWTINTYTISFNANGGKGKMNDISMEYNKITSLNPVKFTRDGYSFQGWSQTPSGPVAYPNLGIYTMGPKNETLYAAWKYNGSSPDNFFTIAVSTRKEVTITGLSPAWNSVKGTAIILPDRIDGMPVTALSPTVFDNSEQLSSIGVDPENARFASEQGVLFSKDMTVLYRYPAGKADRSWNVPDTVRLVSDNAFYGASNLVSVTIPGSMRKIGGDAFAKCRLLSEIRFESAEPCLLGDRAITPALETFVISVPEKSSPVYRGASGWASLANFIQE